MHSLADSLPCWCFSDGDISDLHLLTPETMNMLYMYIVLDTLQAFRFMVGPGHCPMISKYGPSLSKARSPVDPSFLVVKNFTLIKMFILQQVYRKYI